ncbi:hypothetical protein [Burkholderia arboris]|uniref:hypothetical protein n=1 Tax=Burkholderia arboris TaxID=488730 RepID=UPI002692A8EF
MRPFLFLLVTMIATFGPDHAGATIDVLPKELSIGSDTATVQVMNNGGRAEYVTISLSRLLNPGVPLDEEKLEPVGNAARPTLYASPFRLSLGPGQTKTIVLKPLSPVDAETVYRLDVRPEIKVLGTEQQKAVGNVVVNLGFSALVRQLPAHPEEKLSVACDASGARLTAAGNVRYEVKGARVDGRAVERFNVYPGVPRMLQGRVVEIPGQPACRGGDAR